jgi:hypothetical protein
MIRQVREARAQIGGDAILKIDRVQSIDADQQHMVDAPRRIVIAERRCRSWQKNRGT